MRQHEITIREVCNHHFRFPSRASLLQSIGIQPQTFWSAPISTYFINLSIRITAPRGGMPFCFFSPRSRHVPASYANLQLTFATKAISQRDLSGSDSPHRDDCPHTASDFHRSSWVNIIPRLWSPWPVLPPLSWVLVWGSFPCEMRHVETPLPSKESRTGWLSGVPIWNASSDFQSYHTLDVPDGHIFPI